MAGSSLLAEWAGDADSMGWFRYDVPGVCTGSGSAFAPPLVATLADGKEGGPGVVIVAGRREMGGGAAAGGAHDDDDDDDLVSSLAREAAALAAELEEQGVVAGWGSESDYPYTGLVLHLPPAAAGPEDIFAALGLLPAFCGADNIKKLGLESSDDGSDAKALAEGMARHWKSSAEECSVFAAGEDLLNPVPVVCLKRVGNFLCGVISAVVWT